MTTTSNILARVEGLEFTVLDSECCGMGGSFDYERGHFDVSRAVGGRVLSPRIPEVSSMAAEPGARGWWHTLPGLLTATAGTITALAGMLVALHQVGVLNLTGRSERGPGVSDTEVVRSGFTGSGSPQPGVPASGGTPGIGNAPPPTSASSLPYSLGGGGQLRSEGLVYELLDVRLERHSEGNLRLTIPMRVTNTEKPYGWLFGRHQFRLQVDGVLRAPTEGTVSEVVSYYSSLDGHVAFIFPENAREVVLVLIGESGPVDRHAIDLGGPR